MPSVLVADDDAHIREVVAAVLAAGGYEIMFAADGDEAIRVARERRPDAIVLDIMMPGRDGVSACSELKMDPSFRATPIVMLTALSDYESRAQAEAVHADVYVTKPFSPFSLLRTIEHVLDVAESSRNAQR